MFLVVTRTVVVESPLDLIEVFIQPAFLLGLSILIAALLLLFSGKYPKIRPIALIVAAIVFVASIIVMGSPF